MGRYDLGLTFLWDTLMGQRNDQMYKRVNSRSTLQRGRPHSLHKRALYLRRSG